MVITIDGPSGSGKSTVAQKIAQQCSIFYLNTGLLYRALTYLLFEDERSPLYKKYATDVDVITRTQLAALPQITYIYTFEKVSIMAYGKDLVPLIYATQDIDQRASKISAIPVVREFLLSLQRSIALDHDLVADGRDCGTVVFPHAEHKFYLTASLDIRAARRMKDEKMKALGLTFDAVRHDLAQRDERDKNRALAPLKIPQGATIIDSTNLSIESVVDLIVKAL